MEAFQQAVENTPFPIVYNGDLFTRPEIEAFQRAYPQIDTVMVGRGIICNPWLMGGTPDIKVLEDFHRELFESYHQVLFGDGPVLCKMKGVWAYLIQMFTNYQPYQKIIRKTRHLSEYESAVNALFHQEELRDDVGYQPEK
jgi:tRNA-dihydrouridine synthase